MRTADGRVVDDLGDEWVRLQPGCIVLRHGRGERAHQVVALDVAGMHLAKLIHQRRLLGVNPCSALGGGARARGSRSVLALHDHDHMLICVLRKMRRLGFRQLGLRRAGAEHGHREREQRWKNDLEFMLHYYYSRMRSEGLRLKWVSERSVYLASELVRIHCTEPRDCQYGLAMDVLPTPNAICHNIAITRRQQTAEVVVLDENLAALNPENFRRCLVCTVRHAATLF